MHSQTSIVVTSISPPNGVLKSIALECDRRGLRFYVIGDVSSPRSFHLPGCDFYSLERQASTGFRTAELCPKRHYARKNVGYLLSIQAGAKIIVETDDDNYPLPDFWSNRERFQTAPFVTKAGWLNVYRYFTEANIWPRGLPLDEVLSSLPPADSLPQASIDAPIQQGLADENPDVDAIYRLLLTLPQKFHSHLRFALGSGVWCPFNSQNTTWWSDAFALLYLPAYCSFRTTDIWRSFIAQRISWVNGWSILFLSPTVWQDRNEHKLMRDFEQEVPGYLHNRAICDRLTELDLKAGMAHLGDNLRICYEALIRFRYMEKEELPLLEAWLSDLQDLNH